MSRLKRTITNIAIGVVIAIVVHLFHDSPIISRIENVAMDFMINWSQGMVSDDSKAVPFVFIDIDEQTYQSWGEPGTIPKDKLALLLGFANAGDPSVVVVDIDTSIRDKTYVEEDGEINSLVVAASELGRESDGSANSKALNIFVRGFRQRLDGQSIYPELKISILESLLNPDLGVLSASPLFERDLYDHRVRRWRLFETACDGDTGVIVPSVQLIAASKFYLQSESLNPLATALETHRPTTCNVPPAKPKAGVTLGSQELILMGDRLNDRIIYKLPWSKSSFDSDRIESVQHNGKTVPLAIRLPADMVINNIDRLDPSLLEDRIVVIGSSFSENRDSYLTPIGTMPGAVVLINAIHSLLQYGQIQRPAAWIIFSIELVLIIFVSILFASLGSYVAKVISGLIVLALLLPTTFALFKFGVWLDFALPLVGVQLHEMIARAESNIIKHPT